MIDVDIETVGVQWYAETYRVFMVQFLAEDGEPVVLRHPEDREEIQRWLDRDDDFRAWNSKFDFHGLRVSGYRLPPQDRWHDGMVASKLLDGRPSAALKATHERIFGKGGADLQKQLKAWLSEEDKRRKKHSKETGEKFVPANYSDVPDEIMVPYAAQDPVLTQEVGKVQYRALRQSDDLSQLYDVEMQVMAHLFDAEVEGLPVDREGAEALRASLEPLLDELTEEARELAGISTFNPRSSKQLYAALKRRGADLSYVTGESMDAENLATVDDPLARVIERYRGEAKLMSSYVIPMLDEHWDSSLHAYKAPFIAPDGRIHTNFRQVGAITGRMSSSDPNIQNFPRDDLRLRYLVVADPGYKIVTADLDSIELKLFAAYAGDGRMLTAVQDPEADPHNMTADFVGLQAFERSTGDFEDKRSRGKRFNYAVLYGAGVRAMRKWFRVSTKEGRQMLDLYHRAYPEVGRLQRRIAFKLEDQGYIKSAYGRRYYIEAREAYKATNYLVQGTAADMLKISIAELRAEGIPIVAAVHDELVAHVPEDQAEYVAERIQHALTNHPKMQAKVPITAEAAIVDRWSDAKKPGYVPDYAKEIA